MESRWKLQRHNELPGDDLDIGAGNGDFLARGVELGAEHTHLGAGVYLDELGGELGDRGQGTKVGLTDDANGSAGVKGEVQRGFVGLPRACLRSLIGDNDLGADHARADLGGSTDSGATALKGLEQIKGSVGHRNRAKALGEHHGERDILMPGDRHPDIVAKVVDHIFVDDAPDDNSNHAHIGGLA